MATNTLPPLPSIPNNNVLPPSSNPPATPSQNDSTGQSNNVPQTNQQNGSSMPPATANHSNQQQQQQHQYEGEPDAKRPRLTVSEEDQFLNNLSNVPTDERNRILKTFMAKMGQTTAELERIKQEEAKKHLQQVTAVRDTFFTTYQPLLKDQREAEALGTRLTGMFERTLATKSSDVIQNDVAFFSGIVNHTKDLRAENDIQKKKIEDLEIRLTQATAGNELRQYGRTLNNYGVGTTNLPATTNGAPKSTSTSFFDMSTASSTGAPSNSSSTNTGLPFKLPPLPPVSNTAASQAPQQQQQQQQQQPTQQQQQQQPSNPPQQQQEDKDPVMAFVTRYAKESGSAPSAKSRTMFKVEEGGFSQKSMY